ncbi:hypothetical protein KJA15_00915 [Patescibacteria group bacterium]|nr:hypothetical protein [Patescibacteria group bacterium]
MVEKLTKNLIPVAIIIAGLCIAGAIIYIDQGKGISGNLLSPQEAAEKAITFINQNLLQEGMTASLINVVEENGLYKFHLKVAEQEFDSYVTQDGKLLFLEGIDLESAPVVSGEGEETPQEIPKRDTPDVKLFVMSYCPYGLQMQKAFLPVYDLLKDKAKMEVYFVDYIMHEKEEIDENLRQYCIQKEEKEKFGAYLSCFVKDGDFEKCISETNINETKLTACISETDTKYNITFQYNDKSTWLNESFPKFDVHSDLNEKYGVRGSPTVVINDTVVNINPRSPEKFKSTICQAFTSEPQECSQTLSDDVPSPGLGGGTGSSSGGSCQ